MCEQACEEDLQDSNAYLGWRSGMSIAEDCCREILAHDKEAKFLEEKQYLVDVGEEGPKYRAGFF